MLIKLFGHFNLSILRTHFKWEFFVNTRNVVVFFVVLCGANETSEFSLGGGSSSSTLILAEVKYGAGIILKILKQVKLSWCMWDRLWMSNRKCNFFNLNFLVFYKKRGAFYFWVTVNFSLHICDYFENDLVVRKSSKNLLKTLK